MSYPWLDRDGVVVPALSEVVVKGGLDHGAGTGLDRRALSNIVAVERGATVLAKDLAGNDLRVYTTPTSGTLVGPMTADANGRFNGFVEAPDFDLYVTPPIGGAYTQRVRTSPPGVFHANSYGAKPYPNNNAIGTIESQDGINAARAAADASRGWGATVQLDASCYLIGDSIVPWDNGWIKGHGPIATRLYLKAGVNKPVIDSTSLGAGGRYNLQGLSARCQNYLTHIKSVTGVAATDLFTATSHGFTAGMQVQFSSLTGGNITAGATYYVIASGLTANDFQISLTSGGSSFSLTSDLTAGSVKALFPMIKLQCYGAELHSIFVSEFVSDGLMMTDGGSFATDTNTLSDIAISGIDGVSRYGHYWHNAPSVHLYGGVNIYGLVGLYIYSDSFEGGHAAQIQGCHFESFQAYSIYLDGAHGVSVRDSYIFGGPVGLDRNSHNNRVQHNTLLSSSVQKSGHSMIYDGGRNNITTPNKGQVRLPIEGVPLDRLRPASLARDPDLSQRGTTGFTATGGATLEKKDNYVAATRTLDRMGRLPLAILGAAGKGVQHQAMTGFVAGDTLELEGWWWSTPSALIVARAQWKIVDNVGATVLFDSGVLPNPYDATEWMDTFARTVFQVPAGITDVRVEISTPDAGAVYVSQIEFVRSALLNGGFEGAYVGGVAPSWTNVAGAGTPTEENTVVLSGAAAQKLSVAAGQSLTLGQVIVPDEDSFYLLKGNVQLLTGSCGQARIGWGNLDLSSDSDSQLASVSSSRWTGTGVWESLSSVFRPSTFSRLLIGLTSHASIPASAVFDDLRMYPLKEVEGPLVYRSDEIDLTAASKNYLIPTPYRDMRIRRVQFVYSVAATAIGPTIRVGNVVSSNYYCNLGPGVNPQAVGDRLNQTGYPGTGPTRTDVRRGVPIIVTHSGLIANAGKGHVVVECE